MLFSSVTFLFLFLPAVILVHALLPARWRNSFLLLSSAVFYAFGDLKYVPLITLLTVFNWAMGRGIGSAQGKRRSLFVAVSVAGNVLALGYYKYVSMLPFVTNPPTLPLGISFYIFQSLSYLLDVRAGRVPAEKSLRDYATYIMLFPQLIAGPIVRYDDVMRKLHDRRLQPSRMEAGMTSFLLGLASKVLIANALGEVYEALAAIPQRGMLASLVMLLAYGFQLYYDFNGYSLMAIGIGRMLGFDFPKNFDHPFASRSISEFWRRWHMTLGSWLRMYIYIPLGGSRKGTARRVLNLLITWGLSGLWHGAGLNFVAWGLYFGVLIALEAVLIGPWLEKHPRTGWVYAFTAVLLSWILFSCDTPAAIAGMLTELVSLRLGQNVLFTIVCSLPVLLTACLLACPRVCAALSVFTKKPWLRTLTLLVLLVLCVASLLRSSYNPFLYFRFLWRPVLLKKCRSMPLFLAAMLMMILGGLLLLALPKETFSPLENRALTSLSDVKPLSDDFDETFERWTSDHFPGRNAFIQLDAAMSASLGKRLQDNVLLGSDAYLLEVPVSQVTSTARTALDTVEEITQTLKLPTYLLLAPTSAEALPHRLPPLYQAASQAKTLDALYASAEALQPIHSGLLTADNPDRLYYRTDHHLTAEGAWTVYNALCEAWGFTPTAAPRRTLPGFRGSYYARIPDPRIPAEAFTVDIPDGLRLAVDGAERPFIVETAGRNKYASLIGETYAHAVITGGQGNETLLVLSDSYANAIVPLLAQHFSRVDVIDPRYFAGVLADTAREAGSTRVLALFGLNTFSTNRGLALLTIGEDY